MENKNAMEAYGRWDVSNATPGPDMIDTSKLTINVKPFRLYVDQCPRLFGYPQYEVLFVLPYPLSLLKTQKRSSTYIDFSLVGPSMLVERISVFYFSIGVSFLPCFTLSNSSSLPYRCISCKTGSVKVGCLRAERDIEPCSSENRCMETCR